MEHATRLTSILVLSLSMVGVAMAGDEPVMGNASYIVAASDLPRLKTEALEGSGDAGQRLYGYYNSILLNRAEAIYWLQISAENGNPIGQYNWGQELFRRDDEHSKSRGLYWIRLAAKQGDSVAQALLDKLTEERRNP